MSRKTKVFGGKRYYLWNVSLRKGDIIKQANKVRKDGLLARVVVLPNKFAPRDKSYELYVHGSLWDLVR